MHPEAQEMYAQILKERELLQKMPNAMTTNYFSREKTFSSPASLGQRKAWSPAVGALLFSTTSGFRHIGPSREPFPPADPELEREVRRPKILLAGEQIESAVEDIAAAARSQGTAIGSNHSPSLSLLLAWSVYRDRGWLRAEDDPSEPLLRVFEQGYQLNYSDAGGSRLHFDGGWHTLRVPRRSEIAG